MYTLWIQFKNVHVYSMTKSKLTKLILYLNPTHNVYTKTQTTSHASYKNCPLFSCHLHLHQRPSRYDPREEGVAI